MATIKTAIQIQDRMSPALKSMNTAVNIVLSSFEKMQKATNKSVDTTSIQTARSELTKANVILNQAEQEIRDANNNQKQLNQSFNSGTNAANGMLSKIKQIALAIGGLAAFKSIIELSDQVTSNQSRLNLIVDDNGSVKELENKIFASSNRTRTSYLDNASVISKLGILAGDNFENTDEIIAFTELMNKNFAISGASIQEQTSAMYQLTQAMAAGKLQGDEFRSIMENAPLLAEAIANFTGKSKGDLKDLSSEGVITADIIKGAMFASAEEINSRFEKMPMTWGQIWTKMKNIAIKAFQPLLIKINELANNEKVQKMFNAFINGASLVAEFVLELVKGIAWLTDVLSITAPIILGIVAAFVAWQIITSILTTTFSMLILAQNIHSASTALATGSTLAQTAAQYGLNSAMYACPIVWLVALIFALIVALVYLWFTNDKVANGILYAWDSLIIGAMALWLGIKTVFYVIITFFQYFALIVLGCFLAIMFAWDSFVTGLESVGVAILYIFQGLYNGVLWIVNGIIGLLNKIPGVSIDLAAYSDFADKALDNMINNVTKRNEELAEIVGSMENVYASIEENKAKFGQDITDYATEINLKAQNMNATRNDRVSQRNDWINEAGSAIQSALNMGNLDFSNMGTNIGDIASDTGSIKDSLDVTEEEIKYLRDLAEKEIVNRFTTVPLTINMTNNNNIEGDKDIDGITEQLISKLEEELEHIADGEHE